MYNCRTWSSIYLPSTGGLSYAACARFCTVYAKSRVSYYSNCPRVTLTGTMGYPICAKVYQCGTPSCRCANGSGTVY